MTVIKSFSGNVFGGFTEADWHSNDEYVSDPIAFIFSLINKEDKPFKVMCSDSGKKAIAYDETWGPTFGIQSSDIFIVGKSPNIKYPNFCNFGNSYKHTDYPHGKDKSRDIPAGSYEFNTAIEVHTK